MRVACWAVGLLLAAEVQAGPPAHDWGQWGVGTRLAFRIQLETAAGKGEGRYVQTLVQRDAARYAVEESFMLGGPPEARTQEWSRPEPGAEETLELGGAPRRCRVFTAEGRHGEAAASSRAWVPVGGTLPLKMVLSLEGREHASWQAVSFDEAVTVPAGEFTAVRVIGRVVEGGVERRVESWLSPEVPGGAVRTVLTGEGATLTFELLERRVLTSADR